MELGSWVIPFATEAIDLRAFHANPVNYLQTRHPAMLDIKCFDHYIPRSMRTPWTKQI
ncbi:hypothetical protein KGD82_13345 [Nocardiopsis eucommiae]|uniref:Uncharacterized protein n=1 Tax=Nocardiopsis eucommiae TaxID=2831970 RepID=A0A975LBW2_9ACTN|nr:hypothetical protein KGD82_13345 [Nocardiopsis eucommiae]